MMPVKQNCALARAIIIGSDLTSDQNPKVGTTVDEQKIRSFALFVVKSYEQSRKAGWQFTIDEFLERVGLAMAADKARVAHLKDFGQAPWKRPYEGSLEQLCGEPR